MPKTEPLHVSFSFNKETKKFDTPEKRKAQEELILSTLKRALTAADGAARCTAQSAY